MCRLVMFIALAVAILQGSGVGGESPGKNEPVVKPPAVRSFGTLPDGREAHLYTLEVPGGWKATITDYGGILTGFHVPVRGNGGQKAVDVVLGFESLDGYLAGHPYFGAICGRVANRIARGRFTLDGKEYRLATNNGEHHLHGGAVGFDKLLWKATPRVDATGPALDLALVSPDGDEGYPGRLMATVTYRLTRDGELWVEMTAEADGPTLVNLAHHSYWNLAGHDSGTIHGHELAVVADRYIPVDDGSIPTGELAVVEKTPFDLRPEQPARRLGDAIAALPPSPDGKNPGGIDHTFVIRGWKPDGALRPAAVLRDPVSGRTMDILTDQPGVQVYTGNYLDGSLTGKAAATYAKQAGVCLETQTFPDTAHHPEWPTQRLDPGGVYRHTMVHRFRP